MVIEKENYYQKDQLCTKQLIAVYRLNWWGIWKSEKTITDNIKHLWGLQKVSVWKWNLAMVH